MLNICQECEDIMDLNCFSVMDDEENYSLAKLLDGGGAITQNVINHIIKLRQVLLHCAINKS